MKKILFLLLISLLVNSFSSCKKGDEDPFLSFYSRQKRIVGEWKVSEGEIRYDNYTGGDAFYEKYDKNKISAYTSDSYYNYFSEGTFYWNFNINKDGTYTITKSINAIYYNSPKTVEEGLWYFLDKNKKDGYKNKERIAFQTKKFTSNNVVDYEAENKNPTVYEIVELKNKEIKFKRSASYDYNHPINGFKASKSEIFTMIPQDQSF